MRGHCLFSTDTCYKGPSDERTLFSTDTCYKGPSDERTLCSVLIPVIKDPLVRGQSVQCRKQSK